MRLRFLLVGALLAASVSCGTPSGAGSEGASDGSVEPTSGSAAESVADPTPEPEEPGLSVSDYSEFFPGLVCPITARDVEAATGEPTNLKYETRTMRGAADSINCPFGSSANDGPAVEFYATFDPTGDLVTASRGCRPNETLVVDEPDRTECLETTLDGHAKSRRFVGDTVVILVTVTMNPLTPEQALQIGGALADLALSRIGG